MPTQTSEAERPAVHVGPYRLVERIGAGGMGEVFLAERQGPLGFVKRVVVKRLLPHRELDAEARASFFDEARLTAQLLHPNVIQVLELGEHDGRYFIAMEYLPGASVRGLLEALGAAGERLAPPLAGYVCAQALHGLHHAHQLAGPDGAPLGLVHRDVSPENLLVGLSGEVKVVDFGLAKAFLLPSARLSGVIRGKAAYMSPEQLLGRSLDRRSDVYAVGAVLYELLVGSSAIEAHSAPALTGVGAALLTCARRALEKAPELRFASAQHMAEALEAVLREHGARTEAQQLGELVARLKAAGHLPRPMGAAGRLDASTGALPHETKADAPIAARRSKAPLVGGLAAAGAALAAAVFAAWPAPTVAPQRAPVSAAVPAPAPAPAPAPPQREPVVSAPEVERVPDAPAAAKAPPRRSRPAPPPVARAAAPSTGEVVLRAHPWAEVFLDGKSLGTTPMAPLELPARQYLFVFKNPELGTERKVTGVVRAGERVVVKANLLSEP